MKLKPMIFKVIISCIFVLQCYGQSLTPTNGPYGGNIRSLTKNSKNNLLAGTAKGIFYSTNDGNNWTKYESEFSRTGVISIITKDDSIIVAGTGLGTFRSSDGGVTWSIITNGLTNTILLSMAKTSVGDLFGASSKGVFRSINNGLSWIPVNFGLTNTNVSYIMVTPSDYIFAATSGGVFRTNYLDGFWTEINTGIVNKNVLSIAVDTSGVLYAGVAGTGTGIYKSTNNGNTWESTYSVPGYINVPTLTIDSKNNIFAGTIDGILCSTNNGSLWTEKNNGLNNRYINSLFVQSYGNIFAGTNAGGIFRSTDLGENWHRVNEGIIKATITNIYSTPSNQLYVGSSGSGIFRSSDDGNNWLQVGDIQTASSIVQTNSNYLWFASGVCADSTMYYSIDGGNTLKATKLPFGGSTYIVKLKDSVIVAFSGGCSDSSFAGKSIDNGKNWIKYYIGNNINISRPIVSSTNVIFGGSSQGVMRSTDEGASWTFLTQGLTGNVGMSYVAINSKSHLFGIGSDLYRLTDIFVGWVKLNFPLGGMDAIAIDSKDIIYIAVDPYVYRSTDNGDSWSQVAELKNENIYSILIRSDNDILLGTTDGVYKYNPSSTSVEGLSPVFPNEYSLLQNYPNPFNPTTNIEYSLPVSTRVQLAIYDLLGRKVVALVDEIKDKGSYRVSFDATNLSSGIYFYRVLTNEYVNSKKMILMK